jgi:hypothetical protein
MGCGASKGKADAEPDVTEISFRPVGVNSLDNFFDAAQEVLNNFKDITGPLGE